MDVDRLYRKLDCIEARGEIGNAYGGCGMVEEDSDVLVEFFDHIMEKYKDSMPLWAEAFTQIFSWQFQTMHEGAESYYENFHGNSGYETIVRVADYLRENGYNEIAEPYSAAAVDCKRYEYPKDKLHLLPDNWINNNEEAVWDFYVKILRKHREELTMREVSVVINGEIIKINAVLVFHYMNLTDRHFVGFREAGSGKCVRLCCRDREDAETLAKKIREGTMADLTDYQAEWNS